MGFIYLFFLPIMLPSVLPRLSTDSAVRMFPGVWKLLFKTPFPGQSSVPPSFVSFFVLYIFSYLLSKTMGCFSGCLMSSAGIQKLFCGIYSTFKCFFDIVGEKVFSPSYSSAILAPPPWSIVLILQFSFPPLNLELIMLSFSNFAGKI